MSREFDQLVSVTGGTAQNLLTVLQAAGYGGGLIGTELRYRVPDAQSLYLGSASTVNASTGDPIDPGAYSTERATGFLGDAIDPSQKYLFLATTDNVGIFFRAK